MFGPDLVRYIIDPDKETEEIAENRKVAVEKQVFRYSILDSEKVLSDYSFFSKIFSGFGRIFALEAAKKM